MVGWLAVLVFLTCTRMVSSEAGTADGVWIEVKKEGMIHKKMGTRCEIGSSKKTLQLPII